MRPGERLIVHGDNVVPRDLVLGYLRAFYRFAAEDQRLRTPDQDASARGCAAMALFEALNWLDSFEQFMRTGPKDRNADPNWMDRLTDDEKRICEALDHVRNLVHHRWWEALSLEITQTADTERPQENTWVWSQLPQGGKGRRHPGRHQYEDRLLGRPAIEALSAVRDALWKCRGHPITEEDLRQPEYPVPDAAPRDHD